MACSRAWISSRGGRFGVGTDSNVEITAPGELRMLEYSQRLTRRVRNAMSLPGVSTGAACMIMRWRVALTLWAAPWALPWARGLTL